MTDEDAYALALSPDYLLADAAKVTGLTVRQILHAGETKLQLKDWHPGPGNYRRLSLCELFELRLLATVDQRVPPKYLRHLADGAGFYLIRCLVSRPFRQKPAVIVAYPDKAGAWWFLLIHDGKVPKDAPEPASLEMLIVIPVREVLGRLLLGVQEVLRCDLELGWAPEELRSELAEDLALAAAAMSRLRPADGPSV